MPDIKISTFSPDTSLMKGLNIYWMYERKAFQSPPFMVSFEHKQACNGASINSLKVKSSQYLPLNVVRVDISLWRTDMSGKVETFVAVTNLTYCSCN